MEVKEQKHTPDKDAIKRDLAYMMRRWSELDQPVMFELRAFGENKQPHHARFSPDWIDEGVDWAASMNALGLNVYAVRNPIRAHTGKAATDSDVVAAFFLWADCDDPASAGNVHRFDGPKWSAAVTTGRTPSVRVHVYWELEEPCINMDAWRQMQIDIAAHFKSDPAVINPSRIMRVGGTVAYPDSKKQAKGYVSEVATIRTDYDDEREPVSFDQMRRVFPQSNVRAAQAAADSGFHIDTGPQVMDRALAAANVLAGTDWRENVKKLVASYVARGWTDEEIIIRCRAFTLDGYTEEETDKDVTAFIKWTRDQEAKHGGQYATSPTQFDAAPQVEAPDIDVSEMFKPWVPLDALAHPRRDFIYGKHYIRKFASVTVAPGGLGKSSLVLAECIAIATGKPILGISPKQRERVVYFNAEDPREEIERRVLAICQHHQIDQSELAGWFYFQSGRDLNLILSAGDDGKIVEPVFELIEQFAAKVKPGVFAFDPLANMTESPETNDVFRRLGKRLSHMADKLDCSIELVHHTRKLNGNEATVEDSRGGSALIGAVRAGRVLNPMSSDEAIKAGLETHIDHFRIEAAGKNNLSRGDERSTWLVRVDVEIANGEHVAAVAPWEWPDAFDGVTKEDARRVQAAIANLETEPPRASIQSNTWAGYVVGRVLGLDPDDKGDKARINALIKGWLKSNVLALDEVRDSRNGRDVKVIIAGPNNPAAEVSV